MKKTISYSLHFVQKIAIAAAKKFSSATLTIAQQEKQKLVAASLFHLSVNLRPDF